LVYHCSRRNNIMQVLLRVNLRAVYGPFRASDRGPAVDDGSWKYQSNGTPSPIYGASRCERLKPIQREAL
jgi:hypothetical protein